MLGMIVVTVAPLWHVLMSSFSSPQELVAHPGLILFPMRPNTYGYQIVLLNRNVLIGYRNTLIYCISFTLISCLLTSFAAYALSRRGPRFTKYITLLITITMFFSGGLIPYYLVLKGVGLYDNMAVMIIPGTLSVFNIIILRTAFKAIPDSLIEAARIEGANEFSILFRIVVPMAKATLSVIALYSFVGKWNSWFDAAIFLRHRELYPLATFLREILISNDTSEFTTSAAAMTMGMNETSMQLYKMLVKYVVIVISSVPILILYPFLQRYFVKGLLIGSIKE
jgi:putative aldouronate transport system permease protein